MSLLYEVGQKCQEHRKRLGYTQKDVGYQIGYSYENISAFERGVINNLTIFLWYVKHGFDCGVIEWPD